MTSSKRRADAPPTPTGDKKRARRSRPTPKWLTDRPDLDEAARRRCLMILSVLSGERAVTEVIMEAGISRQSYYDLETRALHAMLRAMVPGTSSEGATSAEKRLSELERRVKQLQTEKRRAERLLLLTRKLMRTGRKTTSRRSTRKRRSSTTRGSKPSAVSSKRASSNFSPTTKPQQSASIPTPDGVEGR
jgi:hypothetical protein